MNFQLKIQSLNLICYIQEVKTAEGVSLETNPTQTTTRVGRPRKVIDYNRMDKGLDFSERQEKTRNSTSSSNQTERNKKIGLSKPMATSRMSKKNGGATPAGCTFDNNASGNQVKR